MPLMQILENVYADPYKKTHADSRKTPTQSSHIAFAESRIHSRSISKTLTQRLEDTFAESIKYFAQSTTNSDSLKALTKSVKDNHAASRKRSRSV